MDEISKLLNEIKEEKARLEREAAERESSEKGEELEMTQELMLKMQLFRFAGAASSLDKDAMRKAQERWNRIAKPLHGLGALETAIIRMAGIQQTENVRMDHMAIAVLCGDHGVVREGVTQTDSSVTRIVAENIAGGRGCINLMASQAGAVVFVVDMGMDCPPYPERELEKAGESRRVANRKIGPGTGNIATEPAMTVEDTLRSLLAGIEIAGHLTALGYDIVGIGEMGIGNTTPSSALMSVLLDIPAQEVTGAGAGLSSEALEHKKEVVSRAVERYWKATEDSAIDEGPYFNAEVCVELLSQLGGYEIAAMAGICIGAPIYGLTVVLDGFIACSAAMCASLICPGSTAYLLASHLSNEPASLAILQRLGLRPVIFADMCLGEGTGCAAAMNLYKMGLKVYQEMGTFEDICVAPYQDFR